MAYDCRGTAEHLGRPAVSAGGKRVAHSWRSGWRSLFRLGVTIVLVLLGFAFRRAAAVGKEDAQLQATPQMIGVFSTDPNATIHLTTRVFWRDVNGFAERLPFEFVYVSATVPKPESSTAILITSSLRPWRDSNYKSAVFKDGTTFKVDDSSEYVAELRLEDVEQDAKEHPPYGAQVGVFELPKIIQESHGSFFAHLPEIGINAGSSYRRPYFISERGSFSESEKLVRYPQLKNLGNLPVTGYASSAPSEYMAPPGELLQKAYWQPASLTTTEILENVESELENATVNSIVPSDGHLQDNAYVWEGKGFLTPTMNLTNQDTATSHSDWDFRSGIAFGVAAGTGVAFVQEENNPLLSFLGKFFSSLWPKLREKIGWLMRTFKRLVTHKPRGRQYEDEP